MVDRNERRRRLLEAALELEGLEPELEIGETEVFTDPEGSDQVIMMSPKAARRFGVRPAD